MGEKTCNDIARLLDAAEPEATQHALLLSS